MQKNGLPCVVSGGGCIEPEEENPVTNADHIRSMTDEELAKFILMGLGQYVSCFAEGMFPHHPCPAHNNCLQCGVEWLGQPFNESVWPGLKEG